MAEKSRLGMARVMSIDALGQEALTAALAPARESRSSAFGPHSGTKTVLPFACSFGCLVSAFHKAD
jgi:hypothetical protein